MKDCHHRGENPSQQDSVDSTKTRCTEATMETTDQNGVVDMSGHMIIAVDVQMAETPIETDNLKREMKDMATDTGKDTKDRKITMQTDKEVNGMMIAINIEMEGMPLAIIIQNLIRFFAKQMQGN